MKNIIKTAITVFLELKLSVKIVGAAMIMMFMAGGMVLMTGTTSFCNSCHVMNEHCDSWKRSSHSEVSCLDCHLQPGFAGYVKGKINGMAQSIDCMVGRIGTKPNATVFDASCLRSGCHNTEELISAKDIEFKGIRFKHEKHINKVVNGVHIACGTCHSHFEGDEHISVNTQVCFTCHFFRSSESDERPVRTKCLTCHELPKEVIKRGMVTINHAEFATYATNCEDSCHKRQIEKKSEVAANVCLNCHSFSRDEEIESAELHEAHTTGEKVECFACHGSMFHGPTDTPSVAAMIDCEDCHSQTHNIQRGIYGAVAHPKNKDDSRIVSPMFLTHVDCSSCHIEREQVKYGAVESLEMVAKATPQGCDTCHEKGTGEQYINFWQKKIKTLHKEVTDKSLRFEQLAQSEPNAATAARLKASLSQARSILDEVSSDGSWGVHNFKYTEAILLKARELVSR